MPLSNNSTLRITCVYIPWDSMCPGAARGLEKLGHQIDHYILPTNEAKNKILFDPVKILRRVINHKSQYVFFLNTFGTDPNCDLLKALALLDITCAVWFIDNPFYYYSTLKQMVDLPNLICFQWDKFYIPHLQKIGFSSVHYLPQATDPDLFFPHELSKEEKLIFESNISYSANLEIEELHQQTQQFFDQHPENFDLSKFLMLACREQLQWPNTPSWEITTQILDKGFDTFQFQESSIYLLARILETRLSIFLREEFVKSLAPFNPSLWGEARGWENILPPQNIKGRVSYNKNLPHVYKGSAINLNYSRIQQRFGTNQRVFDVLATQSFLISDYKEELEELFKIEEEIVLFKNWKELQKKIQYYQENEDKKHQILERGLDKVRSQHTYEARMKTLVKVLRKQRITIDKSKLKMEKQANAWVKQALESFRNEGLLKEQHAPSPHPRQLHS